MTTIFNDEFLNQLKKNVVKLEEDEPGFFKALHDEIKEMSNQEFLDEVIIPNSVDYHGKGNKDGIREK